MNRLKELRRHERHKLRGKIQLSWPEAGEQISVVTGNCLDVSVYGMLIESPTAIAPGTQLEARLQGTDVKGEAVVRHCKQYGPWYRIGLRFGGAVLIQETVPHIEEALR